MMRSIYLLLTVLCMLPALLDAGPPPASMTDAYSRGNRAYADGHYTEAVQAYEEALRHGDTANLHFNLANAHAELQAWGPAILHFRKALALDPQHTAARANLRLTEREAKLDPGTVSFWERWAENLPLTVWIVGASIAFWLVLAIWCLGGKQFQAPRLKVLLTLACVPILLATAPALYGYHVAGKVGVVLEEGVTLRVAPTPQSPGSSVLHAGEFARLRRTAKGFYLVELPSGEEGYLAPNEFQPVWDSAPHLDVTTDEADSRES